MAVITTDRLTLAPHTLEDFDDVAAMWSDPRITRHIGGRPFTAEESWARILRYAGLWALLGYGYWAVRESASGRYVGDVGFADFHREITPALGSDPEGGWALASWAQGQRYAREALAAAHDWIGRRRTVCLIAPDNRASLRLAQTLGYRPFAEADYKGSASLLLERNAA